ncbi:Phenazine biosynthesis-like protein, putative [Penicillium digitatum PHI26]|uniref:Phenazine biosynthesis-like protein, putative n=2 Tax=Penicillium digitatum TaxID=36651 RepID=K9G1X3_PEND2|nr:Phenazine biosynthesis-like protein, putative [Penicillium digitatum Pd1]EKV15995.1 Phenazine biosynthesis-like protein, putative [Penicillium digitatum PHI26]EKV20507.1 Phenazine biosynthesis-like protein, putative [Penicillium digitatum Pd1]
MTHLKFVTLDVFTSTPYSGNPLAVVFLPDDSNALTQGQKQTIAREFNLSESVFVHPVREKSKRTIDIFTTDCEIPFAGHPTIGAASWFLSHSTDPADGEGVTSLTTKSGDISISVQNHETKSVSAQIAHNTRIHTARFSLKELVRLHPTLVPFFTQPDITFPLFSIVNGMSQLFVELPSLEALAAVTPATGGELVSTDYLDEGWQAGLICVYFIVRDVEDSVSNKKVIRSRTILGTLEDPATGSAASGLAAYLTLTEGKAGQNHQYHVVQGVEMGRRSDIGVGAKLDGDKKIEQVMLTGTAISVSEGKVLVPQA